jgi:hypothetical protein
MGIHYQIFFLRFEVFTVMTMKNAALWDVQPRGSCENRRFGETRRLRLQGRKISERGIALAVG